MHNGIVALEQHAENATYGIFELSKFRICLDRYNLLTTFSGFLVRISPLQKAAHPIIRDSRSQYGTLMSTYSNNEMEHP